MNGSSLVGQATTLLKNDIDDLPYPEDLDRLSLSFWEEALCSDVLNYFTDYIRLGQNSKLLKYAADLENLQIYSNLFIRMLETIYSNLKASEPIFLDGLIGQPFYFGERPDISWFEKEKGAELQSLIYSDEHQKNLRTVRVLRLYSENFFLLVKPDRLRYWIPSTAVRDVDETVIDLSRQGF